MQNLYENKNFLIKILVCSLSTFALIYKFSIIGSLLLFIILIKNIDKNNLIESISMFLICEFSHYTTVINELFTITKSNKNDDIVRNRTYDNIVEDKNILENKND